MAPQRSIWILCICFLMAIPGMAQMQAQPPQPPGPPVRVDSADGPAGADEAARRALLDAAKKANLERQALLKSDTDKLLKLAEELKTSVDKSNANILSVDVLKKADEIEKLARSVKEKMKGPN